MKRKFLSVALAFCLAACMLPTVRAADDIIPNDASGIPDIIFYYTLLSQADANGDEQLSRSEAAALETIAVIGDLGPDIAPVQSLEGLEYFTGAKELILYNLTEVDLSPIYRLPNVQTVVLMGMDNAGLAAAAAMPGLETLTVVDLAEGQISDLSALSQATELRQLVILNNPVEDLTPLASLQNLQMLALDYTMVTDISPLSGLSQLTSLEIAGNPLSDVSPIADLTGLTSLYLPYNEIETLPDLTGLTSLQPDTTSFEGNRLTSQELRAKLPPQLAENDAWILANKYPRAGDMNGDNTVDISDVMMACKVLARQTAGDAAGADEIERGDMDGNGILDITDVMGICKVIARQNALL